MVCDDCDLETGKDGNHSTDSECMEALKGELARLAVKKGQFTGLLDNCCLRINEGDLVRVGMRRGDDVSGWTTERVVWLDGDREWGLADPKTGEKMQMQWDQELRALVTIQH